MRFIFLIFTISLVFCFEADARLTPADQDYAAMANDSHASSGDFNAYGAYLECVKSGGNCQPPAHMRQALGQGIGVEERVDAILAGQPDPGFQGDDKTR